MPIDQLATIAVSHRLTELSPKIPIGLLSTTAVPHWLTYLSPITMWNGEFPLHRLLRDSLYYPCSGLDGDPVKHLAGNIVSFVYVDRGFSRERVLNELKYPGFLGYRPIATPRCVTERELAPDGRPLATPIDNFHFCIWSVFQRQEGVAADHGPSRFSLLYICADSVATFRAIYHTNAVAPRALALIQPGGDFTNPQGIFARSVHDNPAGLPEVLLYGGYGPRRAYQDPWPAYTTYLCFYPRQVGCVGIWSRDPR